MHVRRDRGLVELLKVHPAQLELVQDLAEDPEVPPRGIGPRDRTVVEDRPLLGQVLAGRDSRGLLRRKLALFREAPHLSPIPRRGGAS